MARKVLGAFALATAVPLFGAAEESRLIVSPDGRVAGAINGRPASFTVNASGLGMPVIAPVVARDLALRHSIFSIQAKVGPRKVPGKTGVVTMQVGGVEQKRRVLWFEAPQRPGYDGVLGPDAVPHAVVVFQLGTAAGAVQTREFPLARHTNRLGTFVTVGAVRIFAVWDLTRPRSLATAAAADAIAAAQGGALSGTPQPREIEFGVTRPVQQLRLARPWNVGPLRLDSLDVRVTDYGSTAGIAQADADQSEIVVTAAGKKDRNIYTVTIGRDDLAGCTRIEFDKPRSVIRLTCA